jgi:hypothetical protein
VTEHLRPDQVRALVKSVATTTIGSENFKDFIAEPTTDINGNAALQITIVVTSLSSATAMSLTGPLDTLVQVHDELLKRGDERFPFIRYMTVEDLQSHDES